MHGVIFEGLERCSRPRRQGGVVPPPFLRGGALRHPEAFFTGSEPRRSPA